ncbi:MAG: response regulator transcription factor [Acidobacteria bacterium]|nr:response regulator transcription factor [Acidobacteriota bacterium]
MAPSVGPRVLLRTAALHPVLRHDRARHLLARRLAPSSPSRPLDGRPARAGAHGPGAPRDARADVERRPRRQRAGRSPAAVKTILVVDDEPQIAEIASDYLRLAGFEVIVAGDGVRALGAVRERRPDLVVLDLGLPRLDGLDVARAIRRDSDLPIIMLTARVQEEDRLAGLEIGADDYIGKPFSPRELVARVRAVLRRSEKQSDDPNLLRVGDVAIDVPRMSVTRGGKPVDLTTTETLLLATMARHPGRVFTRAQLLDAVRGSDAEAFDRAIDSHIKNLRRKLDSQYIETVYGIGYRVPDTP